MSQDVISDVLNQMMNAKRAKQNHVVVKKYSNLLLAVLEIAKKKGYVQEFKVKGKELEIKFNVNVCRAIKPRFTIGVNDIEKYIRRYLPARDFGTIIISTSKGLKTQEEVIEENLGGSLIAYFY